MLGKLFKHEWKASARVYGLLYILTAVYTFLVILYDGVFGKMIYQDSSGWLKGISSTFAVLLLVGYVVILIAVNVLTLVYLIYRFYQTMVSDEGYLTHTLPVTTGQLIVVKTVMAFCFQMISIVVTGLSIMALLLAGGGYAEVSSGIGEILSQLRNQGIFCGNFTVLVILGVLLAAVSSIFNILTYYMCISAGNLFNGHKLLGSVVVYLVFNVVLGIVQTVVMVVGVWVAEKHVDYLAGKQSDLEMWVNSLQPSEMFGFVNIYISAGLVMMIVGCGILFFVSRYLLKNKLNLA